MKTNVPVTNGLFTVVLDFGFAPFDSNARYLEIAVDCRGGLTVLAPRQKLEAVPYTVYSGATRWGSLLDKPPGFADDVDNDTQYSAAKGFILIGTTFNPDFKVLQKRASASCALGSSIRVINIDGTVTCQSAGSCGGSGTVTQLTAGTGIILNPNPITTAGQISSTLGTTISTTEIEDGAVAGSKLAVPSVFSSHIFDGQVLTPDLGDSAVTSAKIANGSITAADLATNSVGAAEIAAGAVTSSKIGSGAVTNTKIASNAVSSTKIVDGNVTTIDLADGAVISSKLANGAVTSTKLASDIQISNTLVS